MPGTMMEFVQRFFNSTRPEITHFDEAHSRVVRGTNVVALYNAVGLRSSWYLIKPDQRLKEPGVAYPQALIFLSGHGTARIGDQTIPIKGGESYYVAPGSDREIWTEGEPLTLIRIAWGKGA
jgi:mannose-6-phosphate isomerase-like protein (cupin superfamily)